MIANFQSFLSSRDYLNPSGLKENFHRILFKMKSKVNSYKNSNTPKSNKQELQRRIQELQSYCSINLDAEIHTANGTKAFKVILLT